MTRDEVKKLLLTMKSLYPNFKPEDLSFTIDSWQRLLANDEPELMMNALYKYCRTSRSAFAPTAAQLLELVADDSVEALEEGEIRAMLNKAARNANYGSEEEFYSLPKDLQKAVGSSAIIRSWGKMETGLDNEITRVIRSYNQIISRRKTEIVTPEGLNLNIKLLSGSRAQIPSEDVFMEECKENGLEERQGKYLYDCFLKNKDSLYGELADWRNYISHYSYSRYQCGKKWNMESRQIANAREEYGNDPYLEDPFDNESEDTYFDEEEERKEIPESDGY